MKPVQDFKAAGAEALNHNSMSTEALIERQRTTVTEHIRHEQVKNWPEVYRTFTPHEDEPYCGVVPFHTDSRR